MKNELTHIEEEVKFEVDGKEITGILTYPAAKGPYPAIILLHGSDRSGKDDAYYKTHAEKLVKSGVVVLRYDGPGWGGQSSENPGFETLESRTDEAVTIVKFLRSRSDIQPDAIGLWGISQGGWICQMAAAASEDVAFIIPTSGPGVTPAKQEVYRVEAESRAEGFDDDEVAKAVLMRRMMVDIVLNEPVYQAINHSENKRLAAGPWNELIGMIYNQDAVDSVVELEEVIALLKAIKNEAWTKFLHLDQILPMFESIPPEAWKMAKGQIRAVLEVDPADFLTKVHCPVLAIFGEADTLVPVDESVALYQKYLGEAGNDTYTIKVFPKASHSIKVDEDFAPGYFATINKWLTNLTFS